MLNTPRIYVAITTFLPLVGGAETQTLAQCQLLQKQGHKIQILTFCHKNSWLPYEVVKGVPVIRVAGALLGNRERWPRLLQQLAYLLAMLVMSWTLWQERKQYDVLQVCQFSLLVLPLAIVCRLAGKPITIVVISAGAGKPTKTNASATLLAGPLDPATPWLRVDGTSWIDGDLYGVESAGRLVVWYLRSLLQQIGAVIIVLSTRTQRYLVEHNFHLPGTQLIPNGVDIVRFHPAPVDLSTQERTHTVVCVSKLRYEKGIDVLLQAWRIVHEQLPQAKLILVGSGPIQGQLEQLADALGIRQSVEFAGLQNDVPAQLQRGSISVLPSRWEGMPNALLEAMASGLACIATRVSGSEDLIQHTVNGLLVESEDYVAMAKALTTLLSDLALVQQYGQAARATIEQQYALEHIIDMYRELYQKLMRHRTQKETATRRNGLMASAVGIVNRPRTR
ncbi:MAG TPA: glycosyltransferase family 4 protein [Ktedonobacteraceae bacterium]|nr:glycosyltransferase family 4 protein [Ktedonobacteraceae bacterium]